MIKLTVCLYFAGKDLNYVLLINTVISLLSDVLALGHFTQFMNQSVTYYTVVDSIACLAIGS